MRRLTYTLIALFLLAAAWEHLHAQTTTTPAIYAMACAYNSSRPTLTTGTFGLIQCNSTGTIIGGP